MGPVLSSMIVIAIMVVVIFACYLIFYRSQAKEINEEFDAKIKAEPWKAELFNTLRFIELRNTIKAEEAFKEYLTIRAEEAMMYISKEKDNAKKD